MRIHGVRIQHFKGLDVTFPWASAMVLFGANDSGKTNVLEGFASNLDPDGAVRGGGRSSLDLLVELDGLDIEGHPDQELFLSWMLSDDPEPRWDEEFPDDDGERPQAIDDLEEGLYRAKKVYTQLKSQRLSFGPAEARRAGRARFDHGVAQLFDLIRELAAAVWDLLLPPMEGADGSGVKSGEKAVESRVFTVAEDALYWLPSDFRGWHGTEMWFEVGEQPPLETLNVRVIRIRPDEGSSKILFKRLEQVLGKLRHEHSSDFTMDALAAIRELGSSSPWVETNEGVTSLRASMVGACAELAARVNELVPPFVSASYAVEITPLFPDEWEKRGRHVEVRLRPRSRTVTFDLELASAGIATWTRFALSEALRLTEEDHARRHAARSDRRPARTSVYVFDEPEAHLHPLAQEQAAAWIAERARAGAHVLLATHAVPFLDLPLEDVEYLKVTRSAGWKTSVEPMTGDILGNVAESAATLGLPPVALIQLTRAWLVVEGEHDRLILEAFHGSDLRQARIRVLPLRGAARAKASFLNLEALAPLGLPFFCLIDNTRAEAVRSGKISTDCMTEEERIDEQLCRLFANERIEGEVLGWPYPDIICALPIEVVRDIARENGGGPEVASEWSDLIARHEEQRESARERGEKAPDFKRYVLTSLGLDAWSPDRLVAETLRVRKGQPPQESPLGRSVSRVLASVDARPFDAS